METKQHATSAKKRQRSENWLDEDKIILQELVKERVGVLENKNTDTNTNAKKVAAWASLHNSFNCMCVGAPRTLAQLKAQWGIIKMNSKKRKAYERRELIKTGGGPPPPTNKINSEDISSWLPDEFIVDTNPFDSDQANKANEPVIPDDITLTNVDLDASSDILTVIIQENGRQDKQEVIAGPESPSPPSPPPPPPPPSSSKPGNRKKKMHCKKGSSTSSAAEKIAETEIACRKELHQAQLKNEEKRAIILDLKEILLKKKIEYYTKMNNNL